ncbi:MAG: hypothetical protein JSU82_14195 [Rhodospirillales bacterium]|nr:MAG: hypothetical protein JSU82_14195 [Rhodospirillales bacterium]
MKQSKRQARDRKREAGKQSQNAERSAAGFCASCGTGLRPDARFCHQCGTRRDGARASARWNSPIFVLYAVIGVALVVAVAGIVMTSGGDAPVAPPAPAARAPSSGAGDAVDLATMSPREAADRLFNRVVMASEQGDMDEALRFAPKAIQAYGQVDRLDADAHYHMGLIYSVMGDFDNVRNQVSIIRQYTPDHLLALILEHDAAEQEGNSVGADRAAAAFAEAYDSEIMAGRPEYDAHRNTIESFRTEKAGR